VQTQEIEVLNILEKVEIEEARKDGEAKDPRRGSATYLLYSTTIATQTTVLQGPY
jgi:hypothetical protein